MTSHFQSFVATEREFISYGSVDGIGATDLYCTWVVCIAHLRH